MAARPDAPATPIASPCVSLCRIDPSTTTCSGCGRTLDEIAHWSTGSDEWRAAIMAALPARRAMLPGRA